MGCGGGLVVDGFRLSVEMAGLPPMNSASNLSRWKKMELKNLWQNRMRIAIGNQGPRVPLATARVWITYFGSQALDYDNMLYGCKHLLDSLEKFRGIKNDGPKYIGIPVVRWQRAKRKDARTLVFVEGVMPMDLDVAAWDWGE